MAEETSMSTSEISIPRVLVIHGPNLNLLGAREPHIYGDQTLEEIDASLRTLGRQLGIEVDSFQSNHEGAIVDRIQQAAGTYSGMIVNAAAYTHTSIAIRDALAALSIPIIEVHLSNIYRRETFRHTSLTAAVVTGQIAGLGAAGYRLALTALAELMPLATATA
jgi:3-dehydroquinate dehydratase-2